MSRSVLLAGTLYFKADIPEQKQLEIMEILEKLCERDFECEEVGEYHIESINWSSHVDADEITNFFTEHEQDFKEYHLDLYYLNEADERWNSDP